VKREVLRGVLYCSIMLRERCVCLRQLNGSINIKDATLLRGV